MDLENKDNLFVFSLFLKNNYNKTSKNNTIFQVYDFFIFIPENKDLLIFHK